MAPHLTSSASVLDPRISLAVSLHAQPGVYALLLGSGASTGAGVLTGWGVVRALVVQAAAGAGDLDDVDPDSWWADHGDGQPLGYSGLLGALATTPAARRALLATFFEPTEDEREQGIKIPSSAHRAIAELVRRGSIRVIVTTNFDRLIEQALEAVGIFPQVIASPSAIEGMEPLAHATCTVIKLHGDYARIDQLNTVEELSQYHDGTKALLDRVLDEYGLVVNGWSGDWDHALVDAIASTRSRRYPLFWTTYGGLGDTANRLVAQHRAQVIYEASADQFFPDLVSRLDALDDLAVTPLSTAMAIARLKRALPNPTKHIELRSLLEYELSSVRGFIGNRSQLAPSIDGQMVEDAHDEIRAQCDTLLHLIANGVYLDRDREHSTLWVWVIEQLMRARRQPDGTFHPFWLNLDHYPALLALKAASLAAVATSHDDVFLRLQREPTWRDRTEPNATPALDALHDYRVLDRDRINTFPKWGSTNWKYPQSRLLKVELRPVILPLVGDEQSYLDLYNRTEYRIALAQALRSGRTSFRSAPGEFILEQEWRNDNILTWEQDFREQGDRHAWGWMPATDGVSDVFSDRLSALSEDLQRSRQWG